MCESDKAIFQSGLLERMSELTSTSAQLPSRHDDDGASLLTRRVYDALAPVYTVSAQLFHSRAHRAALERAGIENGMRVLELAMGSGEMFRRLLRVNPDGQTIGVDLSPKMAALSQAQARRLFPGVSAQCQAADARALPFPAGSFDAVICCYLFELLPREDVASTLLEVRRVLKSDGRLTLTLIAQDRPGFNAAYKVCSRVAPAFWGRQVDSYVMDLLPKHGFALSSDQHLGQLFYSSRVVSARRAS